MATVEHCLFCFEALSANLERRPPMSLFQVQTAWADYPKGLEDDELDSADDLSAEADEEDGKDSAASKQATNKISKKKPHNPTLSRLTGNRSSGSGSSTAGSSSSSLSPSTTETTPSSSSTFMPIGISPRRTSQRSSTIAESPLFVTWNTVSPTTGTRSLRGCIGTFEALPLSTGLSSYALTSALSDHRFAPISAAELPSLEVSVTLLTDFETAKDPLDWELGVHGVRINFYTKNRRYGACYLPDVAVEQGWDKEETIVSLMRKAGWGGKKDKWREIPDFKLVRFQGVVESVAWEEYTRWKSWLDKQKEETAEKK